jgi:RNA-dependent RNA polymerase
MFAVIEYESLLPSEAVPPAQYPAGKPKTLERDTEPDDICDFIVEYIHSDVLVSF